MLPATTPPDLTIPAPPDSGVRATSPERAEELRLVALAQAGDQRAAGALVRDHDARIYHACRNYLRKGLDHDDIMQAARMGFVLGFPKFDASRGWRLSTYAMRYAKRDARMEMLRQMKSARLSVSFDAPAANGRGSPDDMTLHDLVPCDRQRPDEEAEIETDGASVREKLSALLTKASGDIGFGRTVTGSPCLSRVGRDVEIVRRHVLGGETMADVAGSMELSYERVRQIVTRSLPQLRATFVSAPG